MKNKLNLFCLGFLIILHTISVADAGNVPQDWYLLPEDRPQFAHTFEAISTNDQDSHSLTNTLDQIFVINSQAVENKLKNPHLSLFSQSPPPGYPKDWVPWHAEIFTTDLALSARGWLGSLLLRGTATVRAYWRKQYPLQPTTKTLQAISQEEVDTKADIILSSESKPKSILEQLEPGIQAAIASGKIQNSSDLRNNLVQAATEFQYIAESLNQSQSDLPWWVSRFRIDLNIDASGKIVPVGNLGGEVRFRFEWHRIKNIHKEMLSGGRQTLYLTQNPNFKNELINLVASISQDLTEVFQKTEETGLQAHTMRMGIGVSAKGNLGLVKGSAGIVGQIYFTRNVSRPKVNPHPPTLFSSAPLRLIEKNPSVTHLQYAKNKNIAFSGGLDEVVYEIDRTAFRKGLKKAAKIGHFFAERAIQAGVGSWKVYELRVSYDSSISGELDLVTLTGAVTAQIAFFNKNF